MSWKKTKASWAKLIPTTNGGKQAPACGGGGLTEQATFSVGLWTTDAMADRGNSSEGIRKLFAADSAVTLEVTWASML